jgi:hypothetical protein
MVALPPLAERLAARRSFEATEELDHGYCSWVYADETRVLKVPWRGEEATSGWRMAVALSGSIGPRVIEHDPNSGVLLMERIIPGTKLADAGVSEAEARQIWASFREAVATCDVAGLAPLESYFLQPTTLIEQLIETQPRQVALHGDLHHENILQGPDGWKLIDPKGLTGDPAFEAAAFIRNPLSWVLSEPKLGEKLHERILWFAGQLKTDPWRVWAWSIADLGEDEDEPWQRLKSALDELEPVFRH